MYSDLHQCLLHLVCNITYDYFCLRDLIIWISTLCRVGPTGLPLPSQLQQPVMRNNIAVLQTRSGLIKCRPGTSQTNIVLLPSQPRIQRHLPESPPLISNPPGNFWSTTVETSMSGSVQISYVFKTGFHFKKSLLWKKKNSRVKGSVEIFHNYFLKFTASEDESANLYVFI